MKKNLIMLAGFLLIALLLLSSCGGPSVNTDENAALAFGIDEFLFQPNAITLVEWPEQIAGLLARPSLRTIRFRHLDENRRSITFENWPAID